MQSKKHIYGFILTVLLIGGIFPLTGWLQPPQQTAQTSLPPTDSPSSTPSLISTFTRTPRPTRTPFRSQTRTQTPTLHPTQAPTRTRTPFPTATLPPEAQIKGIYGYGQLLPLSCEARAAADWARHFGIDIREMDFMSRMPPSEDPNEGFVGSPYGAWGQIPPNPYGVHAPPVARVLREYGAKAAARHEMRWDQLQAEIASGRPVIVWVVGHVEKGEGVQMEINGATRTVARYEHTVLIIGYEPQHVTILDGKKVYRRPVETFLHSWGALENMAIVWDDTPEE
jgi:uncharacterized protein YvpB